MWLRRSAAVLLVAISACAFSGCLLTLKPAGSPVTFGYTGASQVFSVLDGTCAVKVVAQGASGGDGFGPLTNQPGLGGKVTAWVAVEAPTFLVVDVGGRGGNGSATGSGGVGGFNGGGRGGDAIPSTNAPSPFAAGGVGGASDVRDLHDNLLAAAGGGGGNGGFATATGGLGGAGGATAGGGTPAVLVPGVGSGGGPGHNGVGGGGGLATFGGTPALGVAGTATTGGAGGIASGPSVPNSAFGGGGGGGGYGGGGGGGAGGGGTGGGGGGGARFAIASAEGVHFDDGVVAGDGQVTITRSPARSRARRGCVIAQTRGTPRVASKRWPMPRATATTGWTSPTRSSISSATPRSSGCRDSSRPNT